MIQMKEAVSKFIVANKNNENMSEAIKHVKRLSYMGVGPLVHAHMQADAYHNWFHREFGSSNVCVGDIEGYYNVVLVYDRRHVNYVEDYPIDSALPLGAISVFWTTKDGCKKYSHQGHEDMPKDLAKALCL